MRRRLSERCQKQGYQALSLAMSEQAVNGIKILIPTFTKFKTACSSHRK